MSNDFCQEHLDGSRAQHHKVDFVNQLKRMPVAIETDAANEQHYEVPTEYFVLCLGKHMKYSSCLFEKGNESLSQAEEAMLGELKLLLKCCQSSAP